MTIISTSSSESEAIIRDYLDTHRTGVLATSDAIGNVHSAAIYFDISINMHLLIATKKETQKYRNIIENPVFAMTICDEYEQTALDISGHIRELYNPGARLRTINNMTRQSLEKSGREIPPIEKLSAGDYAAFELCPLVIRLGVYARQGEENAEIFETLVMM